ncbi:LamG-like jellyroll fold domain-containing protein [Bradyrhizobium agreste]|uniref:LamG-like jellyroll fold domain-containing protein n=1 Tax=Bradyrhizobium agreste TaxID=2751811 RepID=UPI001AEE54DB|nr:LamG-like jellyroll fold domain-containing protein [Bradyrhizobium agreste]
MLAKGGDGVAGSNGNGSPAGPTAGQLGGWNNDSDLYRGGYAGAGGAGASGGTGGDGAGGAGGTIKLYATDISAGSATITTSGGLGAGTAPKGGEGRFIIGSNTSLTYSGNVVIGNSGQPSLGNVSDKTPEHFTGPSASNSYIGGTPNTPTIVGLSGGADIYGIISGLSARSIDFDPSTPAVDGPASDALLAVMRFDHGVGGANQDYTGYDLLIVANVSSIAVSNPTISVDGAALQALKVHGIGADQVLPSLAPGQVWAMLIPESAQTVSATIGTNVASAATTISGQVLTDGHVQYITTARPNLSVAAFKGLDAIAAEPGAAHLFGVSTTNNALFVINSAEGSQRQELVDGQNGVTGLAGASSVAVTGANGYVIVAGATNGSLAVFKLDSATGDLTFQASKTRTDGGAYYANLGYDASSGTLTAMGTAGVRTYHVAADGTLSLLSTRNTAASDEAGQGTYHYFVDPTSGSLRVVDGAGATVQTLSGAANGLTGASDVAVTSTGDFVYVTSKSANTLSVFQANGSGQLVHVQTLRNGAEGVRGLTGASDVALTPDDQYVMVTGADGNSLAVFQRNAVTGKLVFAQVVRDGVGGIRGLEVPSSLVFGRKSGTSVQVWVASAGAGADQGGLAVFSVDLSVQAPPSAMTTEHEGIEQISVVLGSGDDTVALMSAPPAIVARTSIDSGDGDDHVVISDYAAITGIAMGAGNDRLDLRVANAKTAADGLTINGGVGADTIDVATTGGGATTSIDGGDNNDLIMLESVGDGAHTDVSGGEGNDTVRVALTNLPATAMTTLHGNSPAVLPGDLLIMDPQDPNAVIYSNGMANGAVTITSGEVHLIGKGAVSYDTFEGYQVLSSPKVSFSQQTYSIAEGQDVVLTVTVLPLGTKNALSGPVAFDIDGDGQFGEIVGTSIGSNQYRVTIPWQRLVDFGLNDNGTYRIAVQTSNTDTDANGDYLTTTAVAAIKISDTPPTVTIAEGLHNTTIGTAFSIDFSAVDPSPVDRVLEWRVDWGDGSATEVFGADTSHAVHTYQNPGIAMIRVNAEDKDTIPGGTSSNPYTVTVGAGAANVNAHDPYRIKEGDSLKLSATADGAPSDYAWDLNADGTADAHGSSATLTWVQLQTLGIADSGVFNAPILRVTYPQIGGGTTTVAHGFSLIVDNAPPTFTSMTNSGPVNEGGTATVAINGANDPSPVDAASLKYRFDFNNDGSFDTALLAGSQVTVASQYLRQAGNVVVHGQVVDKDGGIADAFTTIVVNEVPPTLTVSGAAQTTEGAKYSLDLSASDPGADMIRSWDVNWGDGSVDHVVIDPTAANGNATVAHVYADNGNYTVRVGATDNDGSYAAPDAPVAVVNVPPALSGVGIMPASGAGPAEINENDFARLTGKIVDPGRLDSFSLAINWGDGSQVQTVSLPAGVVNFDVSHRYVQDGSYQVTTSAIDKDGGSSSPAALALKVDNVAPVAGSLNVVPAQQTEGSAVTVSGTYTDAGPLDSHTVRIDWGDGTSSRSTDAGTTIVVDQIHRSFMVTRVYADNPDLATRPGSDYAITAIVTDERGADSNAATASVVVQNTAPIFVDLSLNGVPAAQQSGSTLPSTIAIDENGIVTMTGHFTDAGIFDTHTGAVVWGDGDVSAMTIDDTAHTFTASHRYLDDNPTGTASDPYRITATLTDKDGATASIDAKVTVDNVAPSFVTFTNNAADVGNVLPGEPVILSGLFNDPGTLDTYTVVIDWGDGTAATQAAFAAGTRDFTFSHLYRDPGFWTISARLADDDLGVATATTEARLSGVALQDGVLRIGGTSDADTVVIRKPLDPIAYWNFNETSGTKVADSAGTPQDGKLYSDRALDLADPGPSLTQAPFNAQNSTEFHGDTKEYVAVAADPVFQVANGTVQFWFNADQTHGKQTLFAKDRAGVPGGLNIGLDGDQLVVTMAGTDGHGGCNTYTVCSDQEVRAGQWHHVAFTFGDSGMSLYLDGKLVGENAYTGGLTQNREAIVMGGSNSSNRDTSGDLSRLRITDSFDGHIDEVAFYGQSLNATQIADLITKGANGANDPNGNTIEVYADFLPKLGQDVIKTFNAADVHAILVVTGGGNDVVRVDQSVDVSLTVNAGDGNDQVFAGSGPATLIGGNGNDLLVGGPAHDAIYGSAGDDYLVSNGGNDLIDGGAGIDTVSWPIVNPISYWNLNETSGRTFTDSVGTNNGTYYGKWSPDLGEAGAPATSYDTGTAVGFGNDPRSYVAVANNTSLQVANGTIQFWFNADNGSDRQTLFAKDGFGNNAGDLNISLDGHHLSATMQSGTATYQISSCDDVGRGWHHVAFTFGSGGMKLYLDGALAGSNAYTGGLADNRQAIVIGASNASNRGQSGDLSRLDVTNLYRGEIDEVAVFGQALDASQIRRLTFTGPRQASAGPGLSGALADYQFAFVDGALQVTDTRPALPQGVAYWSLNETSGSTLADATGLSHTATFKGTPDLGNAGASGTVAPFGAGTSAEFHGDNRSYIAAASSPDLQLAEGTIQLWFNASRTTGVQTLFAKDGIGVSNGLTISLVDSHLEVQLEGDCQTYRIETCNIVGKGGWNQLALTFGAGGMKLYLNDVLVGENAYTGGIAANTAPIVIGGSDESNSAADLSRLTVNHVFNGFIDEVAIFNGAFNQTQVGRLMNQGAKALIDAGRNGPTIDGTDQYENVERLSFGDGTTAYVLGAGSSNPSALSAKDIQALAGNGTLAVLGPPDQSLRLIGAWSDLGTEKVGATSFTVFQSGATQVLVQAGVDAQPDQPLLTPIGYWNFNDTSSIVHDSAGTPQDGTFFAAGWPDRDDAGPPASVAPVGAGTAADVHGNSREYIAVAHDAAFEVANGTVDLWFDARGTSGQQTLFAKDGADSDAGLTIGLDGDRLVVRMEGAGTAVYSIRSTQAVTRNSWHNIAFTFGADGMKLYLDGALAGTNAYTGGLVQNRDAVVIGGSNETNTDRSSDLSRLRITKSFNGLIDEVAMFGSALSAGQVQQLIAAGPLGVVDPSGVRMAAMPAAATLASTAVVSDQVDDDWLWINTITQAKKLAGKAVQV